MNKIYTRTGDRGTTSLADGSRVFKDHIRLKSYGTLDELNSVLSICRESLTEIPENCSHLLDSWLFAIQNDLFNISADLATPLDARRETMVFIAHDDVKKIEKLIDFCQSQLAPLTQFILPGGTLLSSYLHFARTVCRRAERHVVTLSEMTEINSEILPFLNRLSDCIFVFARWVSHFSAKKEVFWNKDIGVRSLKNFK